MEKRNNSEISVGGWLLLFCLGLTILGPLITIFNLWSTYELTNSLFDQYPGYQSIYYIDCTLSLLLTILSIRAGLALWGIKPRAVKKAKNYLLLFLGYSILAMFLPFMAGLPSSSNDAMTAEVVKNVTKSIIYFTIWYSYLNVSTRVKATYEISTISEDSFTLASNSKVTPELEESKSETIGESSEYQSVELVSTQKEIKIEIPIITSEMPVDVRNWYLKTSADGSVDQIVLSFPVSSIKETDLSTIILPAHTYPVLSSNSWCAGFCRIDNKNAMMLRAGIFAAEVKEAGITVALSFCRMPSHPLFLVSVRVDEADLVQPVRNKYPHVPSLAMPVAEWLSGLSPYDRELIPSVFRSDTFRVILAKDSLSMNHVYMPNGEVIETALPEAICEYKLRLDNDLQKVLLEQWGKLINYDTTIPYAKRDFQKAVAREIVGIMPLDKDPIFQKDYDGVLAHV